MVVVFYVNISLTVCQLRRFMLSQTIDSQIVLINYFLIAVMGNFAKYSWYDTYVICTCVHYILTLQRGSFSE